MLELRSMELNGGLRVNEQELRLPTSLKLLKNRKRSDSGKEEGSKRNIVGKEDF